MQFRTCITVEQHPHRTRPLVRQMWKSRTIDVQEHRRATLVEICVHIDLVSI